MDGLKLFISQPAKTEFLLIGLPAQLFKIHNPTLTISSNTTIQPVSSARNLGIFDSNLSFSDHISYISKSCFSHIRDLRRIRNTLDHKTACTIATSLIHSKLDYCNSLYLNISNQQLNRLQLILNSAARAVTKTPKFHHITPHLKSLHWLKITQRIQYKILSLTYKSLQYNKPSSISDLLTIQPTRSTRSSAVVTLRRPSNPSRLKISDRSFYFQAPALWNALPHHLRSHSHSSQSHSLLSLITIFFSIPQAAENSPFSSFLSSLAYLFSSGLTPWNFDLACLSLIIHSISFILDPFICSTR